MGLSAKDTGNLDKGIADAAKAAPVADVLLAATAPSVEEKAHAILDQVGQVTNALLGVTKTMQATAAAQAAAAPVLAGAPAAAGG